MEAEEEVEPPEGRVAFSALKPELEAEEVVEDPEDAEGLVEDVVEDLDEAVVDTNDLQEHFSNLSCV